MSKPQADFAPVAVAPLGLVGVEQPGSLVEHGQKLVLGHSEWARWDGDLIQVSMVCLVRLLDALRRLHRVCLNLHPRPTEQAGDLDQRSRGPDVAEYLAVGAGDQLGFVDVRDVGDRTDNGVEA